MMEKEVVYFFFIFTNVKHLSPIMLSFMFLNFCVSIVTHLNVNTATQKRELSSWQYKLMRYCMDIALRSLHWFSVCAI